MKLESVDNLKFGSNQVNRAFLGSSLVWSPGEELALEVGALWVFAVDAGDVLGLQLKAGGAPVNINFHVQGSGLEASYEVVERPIIRTELPDVYTHTFQNSGTGYITVDEGDGYISWWDCLIEDSSKPFGGDLDLSKISKTLWFQHRSHFTKITNHSSLENVTDYRDYFNLQDIYRPEISSSWNNLYVFNISNNSYLGPPHSKLAGSPLRYVVDHNKLSGDFTLNDPSFNNLEYYWIHQNNISGAVPDVFEVGKDYPKNGRKVRVNMSGNDFTDVSNDFGFNDRVSTFSVISNSIKRSGLDKILMAVNGLYSDFDDVTVSHQGDRVNMKFTDIENTGNPSDSNGTDLGGVDYSYSICKYEVTNSQFDVAVSNDSNIDGSIGSTGGGDEPVTNTSWIEAAKYANWLTTGDALRGAYQFSDSTTLLTIDREAALELYKVVYVIPNENEWYKAAYFKSDGSGYTEYTTGDTIPTPGVDSNYGSGSSPWDVGSGTEENNGTYDMGGNAYEWTEEQISRGGSWSASVEYIKASGSVQSLFDEDVEVAPFSFRVAALSLKYDNRSGAVNQNPAAGSTIDLRNNDPLGPTGGSNNVDYLALVNKGWTITL